MPYNFRERFAELLPGARWPSWPPQMPFVDFHQMNLDWILEAMRAILDQMKYYFIDGGSKETIEEVMEEHPEWWPRVQDGAITSAQINSEFLKEIENAYVTPEMFGAVGDGVTDDTAALQAAIDAGRDTDCPVYLKNVYLVSDTIKVYGVRDTSIDRGSLIFGNKIAEIKASRAMAAVIQLSPKTQSTAYGITLKDFNINGDGNAERGLYSSIPASECVFSDLTIKTCNIGIEFASNCYLNTFYNIRTYHCTNYGFYIHDGADTANVYTKCYVDSSAVAYRLVGIYSTLISCCADNASDTVFYFSSFRGSMIGCGTESTAFNTMIHVGRYSNVEISGGMYYGNPNLDDSYIIVEIGSNLTITGCTMNYHTVTQASGKFLDARGGNRINIQNVQIYAAFPNPNSVASNSRVIQPGANIIKEDATITFTNGIYTTAWTGNTRTILSISTSRSGWIIIPFLEGNIWKFKIAGQANYQPNIADPTFNVSIFYVMNETI